MACLRPLASGPLRRLPLRPVRPECPKRTGVLRLPLFRLVSPNPFVLGLTTRSTSLGLLLSEHPPLVSSRLGGL